VIDRLDSRCDLQLLNDRHAPSLSLDIVRKGR
jgi:hypothetical protein